MKLYKLTFNEYTNAMNEDIACYEKNIQPKYITVEDGVLYVAIKSISELKQLDNYGHGIKSVEFLGGILILEKKGELND